MEGLPAAGKHGAGGHEHYNAYILELPAGNGTPYRFVELDWNPNGHGGPYTAPHFDFHFYRVIPGRARRDRSRGARLRGPGRQAPGEPAEMPAGYVSSHLLMNLPPEKAAVPKMGLHWLDMARPSCRRRTSRSPRRSSSAPGTGR